MGSCDPRHLKASVAWSFPRWGEVILDTAVIQTAARRLLRKVMPAGSRAHALLAREGALGVVGKGCAVHDRSVVSKGWSN